MSVAHYLVNDAGSAIDVTGYVRRGWELKESAEEGAVAMSHVVFDDPDEDLTMRGHRAFYSVESAAGTENIFYYGFVASQDIGRGEIKGGRQWDVDLADINSVIFKRVMTGSDCDRPAETDVERIEWLLTTDEGHGFGTPTTNVSTASPVDMDASDYRGQMLSQVIDDCAQQSGANWYAQYWVADGEVELWYGASDLSTYASDLSLSNDPADLDTDAMTAGTATVWPLSEDTKLTRDPSRVFSGVLVNWDGGSTYRRYDSTETLFTWRRDAVMQAPNVHTSTKAIARNARYGATLNTQELTVTTSVTIPAALVDKIRPGMLIDVTATHLPDFESAVSCRVLNRSVKQFGLDAYTLTMELAPVPCTDPISPRRGGRGRRDSTDCGLDQWREHRPLIATHHLAHRGCRRWVEPQHADPRASVPRGFTNIRLATIQRHCPGEIYRGAERRVGIATASYSRIRQLGSWAGVRRRSQPRHGYVQTKGSAITPQRM